MEIPNLPFSGYISSIIAIVAIVVTVISASLTKDGLVCKIKASEKVFKYDYSRFFICFAVILGVIGVTILTVFYKNTYFQNFFAELVHLILEIIDKENLLYIFFPILDENLDLLIFNKIYTIILYYCIVTVCSICSLGLNCLIFNELDYSEDMIAKTIRFNSIIMMIINLFNYHLILIIYELFYRVSGKPIASAILVVFIYAFVLISHFLLFYFSETADFINDEKTVVT